MHSIFTALLLAIAFMLIGALACVLGWLARS
jgi:hypothetical protein